MDLSPRAVLFGLVVVGVVALVGAISGAVASVAYQALSSRGERARFDAELDPVRDDVDALRESFTRWRTRSAKRVRDEKEQGALEFDPGTPPTSAEERQARLARIRAERRMSR